MQLPEAAIDQHQAGHRFFFLLQSLVVARNHLAHRSEIIDTFYGSNDEFPVVRLLHPSVFPHHHRGHGLCALNVRDVEAFDALGQIGQAERVL